jgi:predicted ATPase/transcriptional regulator with XRE-family HTH domain
MQPGVPFGQWVQLRRAALHMTQRELAGRVFCSEIMIRKIESDERRPSVEIAERLASELQLPANLHARFVKIARGELSIEQLPELQTAQADKPAWPALAQAGRPPAPTTSFIGRTQELAQICELLLRPDTRLLTLLGPPGIGKTRLALHVAGELQPAFLHGVTYVPLASIRDAGLVIDAIAQLLGFAESAFPDPLDFLHAVLRARHRLLVLDNCEQVLPAAGPIAGLLEDAPHLTILTTSRTPLNVSCERLWPVQPLGLPEPGRTLPVEAAIQRAAVQLFVTRARDVEPSFTLTAENVTAVCELCTRLDGLPLAIELAAARTRLFTPQALLARLSDRLSGLGSNTADRPLRHHTLHNAIAWSFDLLPSDGQRVYMRLGVFLHGATLEAAQVVCATAGDVRDDLVGLLALLVDHSLVRSERDAGGDVRFAMLETTRDYALEQLVGRRELESTRGAHARYFATYAESHAPKLHGVERRRWLERFEREADNLRAALRWAEESGDTTILARLAAALGWFWEMQGRRQEARTWLAAALTTPAEEQPPGARARLLHMAGHIANEEGDLEYSRRLSVECLIIAEALGDGWTTALAQRDLGWVYFAVDNDVESGIETATRAARGLLAAGDLRNYLLTLLDVAMICQLRGAPARGMPYAEEALRLAQEWDDAPSACEALSTLGLLADTAGDYERALALIEECLALAVQMPNGKLIAWVHYRLAYLLMDRDNLSRAAEHFAASAQLWRERNEVLAVTYCQSGEANCLFRLGAVGRAKTIFQATLEIYRRFNDQRAVAWTQWNLACVAAVEGNGDIVQSSLVASLEIFRWRNDAQGIACCEAALQGEWGPMREPHRQ